MLSDQLSDQLADRPEKNQAAEELIRRIEPKFRVLLWRYDVPREDAEDLIQEALLAYVFKAHHLHDPESWLMVVLTRQVFLYYRRRRRRPDSAVFEADLIDLLSDPKALDPERVHLVREIRAAVGRLRNQSFRQILELRFFEGLDVQDIATRLGYQPSSVLRLTHRAVEALKRSLSAPPQISAFARKRPSPSRPR
jgi:RNA polymerase sigma factor (sigma-70 family)